MCTGGFPRKFIGEKVYYEFYQRWLEKELFRVGKLGLGVGNPNLKIKDVYIDIAHTHTHTHTLASRWRLVFCWQRDREIESPWRPSSPTGRLTWLTRRVVPLSWLPRQTDEMKSSDYCWSKRSVSEATCI